MNKYTNIEKLGLKIELFEAEFEPPTPVVLADDLERLLEKAVRVEYCVRGVEAWWRHAVGVREPTNQIILLLRQALAREKEMRK